MSEALCSQGLFTVKHSLDYCENKMGQECFFFPLHRRSRAGALFSPQARFRQSTLDPVEVSQQLQRHLEKKTKNNTTTVTLSHNIPAGQGSQSDAQAFPVPFPVTKRGSSSLWRLFMGLQESLSALGDVTQGTASPTNSLPKKKIITKRNQSNQELVQGSTVISSADQQVLYEEAVNRELNMLSSKLHREGKPLKYFFYCCFFWMRR